MTVKIALKVEEAAEYTGIGRNTMRDLVKAKKIVSENLGHHRYKVTRIYLAEENPKKKAQ